MDVVDGTGSAEDNGCKRHITVDALGLLLVVHVTAASVQDRHGARVALARLRELFTTIALVGPTALYSGNLITWVRQNSNSHWKSFAAPTR
ncbi:transposase [Nocardia terpenica]|uniref:transposase n=1 Tax=Nocardia terpenica TaxID=455432 RepID=UPI002FDF531C